MEPALSDKSGLAVALQTVKPSLASRAAMSSRDFQEPLVFQPIFMERVWGGRRLESLFGKQLPAGVRIGESWEIVDRQEAQSVVAHGPLRGQKLHDLWMQSRGEVFGEIAESERFPLLIKLLDAQEKLSIQ